MFELSKEPLTITDHCLVRYLERAMGLNMDMVREHIRTICATPAAFGAVAVRSEGLKFVIKDNSVVTVTRDISRSDAVKERKRA